MDIDLIFQGIIKTAEDFLNLPWVQYFTTIRFVFIILDILVLVALFYFIKKARAFAPPLVARKAIPSLSGVLKRKGVAQKYAVMWEKIKEDAHSAPPHSYTTAIVNADILIDELLIDAGFEGKDMAARLGKLNGLGISSLNGVWNVHKLRNKIVHTSGYEATKSSLESALQVYEAFLKEIKVLE